MGREAVLDVLSRTEDHLSAEDIYMCVHETYPAIGLTSVYRTLDMLVNIGRSSPSPRLHGLRSYRQLP